MINPILSIIVPVFNKWAFTKSCLEDLSKLPQNHEIIILNNGTDETDSEIKQFQQKMPNLVYIKNEQNLGYAKTNNLGYRMSRSPNVMFLNNDIKIEGPPTWTQIILKHCDKGLVGPTMGELNSNFSFVREANQQIDSKYAYMGGWCLSSSKKIFDEIAKTNTPEGVFCEDFPHFFEDTHLSFTARKLKIPFIVVEIPVIHIGQISGKQLNIPKLYYESRSIFTKKWKQ